MTFSCTYNMNSFWIGHQGEKKKKNSGTFSMMHQIVLLGNKSIQQEDQFGIITFVIA